MSGDQLSPAAAGPITNDLITNDLITNDLITNDLITNERTYMDIGVIAVDGPSGSGKSSVCREVARKLGLRYLDTGAMYRAVTWACLERGLSLGSSPDDRRRVAAYVRSADLCISTDPDSASVVIDGVDVTTEIRDSRVSAAVSAVATNLEVRAELVRRQRVITADGKIIVEGRDITTVVAPDAPVRLLLTASPEARLARRARELHGSTGVEALAATRDQVLRRDEDDATVSEFRVAVNGAVEVDTSSMSFRQVVDAVLDVVAARQECATVVGASR